MSYLIVWLHGHNGTVVASRLFCGPLFLICWLVSRPRGLTQKSVSVADAPVKQPGDRHGQPPDGCRVSGHAAKPCHLLITLAHRNESSFDG